MKKSTLILLSLLLAFSSFVGIVNAKSEGTPEGVLKANQILKSNLSEEEKIKALQTAGWEVGVSSDTTLEGIETMSLPGCAKISYLTMKQADPYYGDIYLVQGDWKYDEKALSSCTDTWDSGSGNVWDYFVLGIVDSSGNSINAVPEWAGYQVRDRNASSAGDAYGNINGYTGSSTKYVIMDSGGLAQTGIQGSAWFYVRKQSTGKSYYLRSQWNHTWSSTSINLESINLSYPWKVDAKYSNSTKVNDWGGGIAGQNLDITSFLTQ